MRFLDRHYWWALALMFSRVVVTWNRTTADLPLDARLTRAYY